MICVYRSTIWFMCGYIPIFMTDNQGFHPNFIIVLKHHKKYSEDYKNAVFHSADDKTEKEFT